MSDNIYQTLLIDYKQNLFSMIEKSFIYLKENQVNEITAFAVNISDDLVNINCLVNTSKNENPKCYLEEFDIELNQINPLITSFLYKSQAILLTLAENYCNFFTGKNYSKVKNDIIQATIDAIQKAKQIAPFDTTLATFFVIMETEMDEEEFFRIENSSAQQLNNEKLYHQFKNRFQ